MDTEIKIKLWIEKKSAGGDSSLSSLSYTAVIWLRILEHAQIVPLRGRVFFLQEATMVVPQTMS